MQLILMRGPFFSHQCTQYKDQPRCFVACFAGYVGGVFHGSRPLLGCALW